MIPFRYTYVVGNVKYIPEINVYLTFPLTFTESAILISNEKQKIIENHVPALLAAIFFEKKVFTIWNKFETGLRFLHYTR